MEVEGKREQQLREYVLLNADRFFLSQDQVQELLKKFEYPNEIELLEDLVGTARTFARPHISNFFVGVAGLTNKGNIYLGVNIESTNQALNQSIHGEQCMISRLLIGTMTRTIVGEYLVCFAVSAAPCGHCRQFLAELLRGLDVQVIIGRGQSAIRKTVGELLPDNFSPRDLGNTTPLFSHAHHQLKVEGGDSLSGPSLQLFQRAVEAASYSYSPYTNSPAGVAVRTKDGKVYQGIYIENVAFNPSLSPLQGAMTGLVAEGQDFANIEECFLVEREHTGKVCQETITRLLLSEIAPKATMRLFKISM